MLASRASRLGWFAAMFLRQRGWASGTS